jgi:hypothetical protein
MGIFSSKYVTQVGTSVSRVVEDISIPQSTKSGVIKSLFNDGNLPDYVMEELVVSMGVRAERMYKYAEDKYVHGLPSGEFYSSTQGRVQVEAVIEAAEGQQVLMKYSNFGPPNTLHIGWIKLVSLYGYNTLTNQLSVLSAQKGKTVYLEDMVVVVPASQFNSLEAESLQQWGTSAKAGFTPRRLVNGTIGNLSNHSPILKSDTATELHLKVTYVWETSIGILKTESLTISVADYDPAADYFHANYEVNGQPKYWIYKNDSGLYPTLDAVFVEAPAVSGSYFPFAYFRYNKQSVIQNKTTEAYKTSKKMVDFLGIDYDVLAEAIDENPDIGDVEQAILMMAVPSVSTNAIECRYLFDYFDTLHFSMSGSVSAALASVGSRSFRTATNRNSIVIQDAQFKMALQNGGIYKRLVAGSVGTIGTHTSQYVITSQQEQAVDESTGETTTYLVNRKSHVYRKQISLGLYEEITVRDLRMVYWVFGEYTTTADETDDILLIPIDRTVSSLYSMGDREELYTRSLHFVFNSLVVTKVKWYQTGIFKALLFIVAVVITIYNPPAGLAALQLTGAALVVAAVVITLVVGEIVQRAFKLFVKAFGADVAQAIAIVALLYGGYRVFQNGGSLQGTWASELLQLSSGLQSAAFQDKFSDLLEQQEQFNLFVEEQENLLESAQKLLETGNLLAPFVIFGEKPEDFYNRTIHYGNIGTLGITAISSYVDIALTLPKLNDTVGEEIYEL